MVRGKNEYLYGSVRAEMVVKLEASEKRVNFVGLLNLSTEMDTHQGRQSVSNIVRVQFPSPVPSLVPPLPSAPLPRLPSTPFTSPPFPLPLRSRPPFAARGSGGALKLPQRVRAEPGRQTHFGAF